jgi:shingomyelin synthase
MRRIFLLMSLLYFMRAITMYVTVLPISSTTYYCSPKLNETATAYVIVKRALILISGFGLSINGKHTYCGDYIYSGHTVMLVLAYLVISECEFHYFFLHAYYNVVLVLGGS